MRVARSWRQAIRAWVTGVALIAVPCAHAAHAADAFPNRPIKLLLGYSAGGATDTIARYYAMKMSDVLKVPVVIENRPGAFQLVAIRSLMTMPPDGYTYFFGAGSAISVDPALRAQLPFPLPYDPLSDFTPVALVGTTQAVLIASPSLPVTNVRELVAYAKAHPGKVNYGSSGVGSGSHLQTEYLSTLAGIKMTHVPYHADSEIITSIAQGAAQLGLSPIQGAYAAIRSGMVRGLAVTGSKRLSELPSVPAMSEVGVPGLGEVEPYTYYALLGPKGIPPAITAKVNAAVNQVSRMPETVAYMHKLFYEPATGSPEELHAYIASDIAKWQAFGQKVKLNLGK